LLNLILVKNMKKFFSLAILMLAFGVSTFAQVTATATVAATIISPIAITKNVDMNFGNLAVGTGGGTVVLATDGSRSVTGDVTLPANTGSPTAAAFTVTGAAAFTYSIGITGTPVTIRSGVNSMQVNTFITNPLTPGTLPGFGPPNLLVGATLTVGASQAAGSYSSENAGGSGPFTVTVNYN
jgi:hypothetical protein